MPRANDYIRSSSLYPHPDFHVKPCRRHSQIVVERKRAKPPPQLYPTSSVTSTNSDCRKFSDVLPSGPIANGP